MVFMKNKHTEASQRYLEIDTFIGQHMKLTNAKDKIMPLHLMAQMEIHTITILGGCTLTLTQEQTSHSESIMPLTQHGDTLQFQFSSRVHNNHILYRTVGGVVNEDACI